MADTGALTVRSHRRLRWVLVLSALAAPAVFWALSASGPDVAVIDLTVINHRHERVVIGAFRADGAGAAYRSGLPDGWAVNAAGDAPAETWRAVEVPIGARSGELDWRTPTAMGSLRFPVQAEKGQECNITLTFRPEGATAGTCSMSSWRHMPGRP